LVAVFSVAGWLRLQPADSLRHWQGAPAQLLHAQSEIGRLLGTPSVAQFYLVRGASPQQVLEREEALKERLDALVARGGLAGYAAVSDWVPSVQRQRADAQLTARAESQVFSGVNAALGEALQRPVRASTPVTPQTWLQQPLSPAARGLWLGESAGQWSSVLMLHGLRDAAQLPALQAAAQELEGVRWVDKSAEVSSLLGRYRWAMAALLLAGHVAVLAALWWRYRGAAWRAWLPTAAGTAITLACLGWLNEPFQLSTVLALLLLLGIGVDYGIFLLEHDGDGSAWLAVVLGAASTWLAFGLLALSTTPALHAFGLTLLIGILLVWGASPWLRRPPSQEAGT
jgi:predicted exporter